MRATVMHKAGDVRIENVPDAAIQNPTDAVIRITRACICGSDLWPYNAGPNVSGQRMRSAWSRRSAGTCSVSSAARS
jgi:threonine dehydrogenase-like Zn-dependent dehydrogenase